MWPEVCYLINIVRAHSCAWVIEWIQLVCLPVLWGFLLVPEGGVYSTPWKAKSLEASQIGSYWALLFFLVLHGLGIEVRYVWVL